MDAGGPQLIGFSVGNVATNPGNRDISATRNTGWTICANATSHLALGANAPPVLGTTVQFTTSNIPAGSPFGALLVNFGQQIPPQDLTGIGMAGCFGYVFNSGAASFLFFPGGPTVVTPFAVVNNASFLGVELTAQSFTYSPPLTVLGAISSNGQAMVIGM
jgi:hypothetical protein